MKKIIKIWLILRPLVSVLATIVSIAVYYYLILIIIDKEINIFSLFAFCFCLYSASLEATYFNGEGPYLKKEEENYWTYYWIFRLNPILFFSIKWIQIFSQYLLKISKEIKLVLR